MRNGRNKDQRKQHKITCNPLISHSCTPTGLPTTICLCSHPLNRPTRSTTTTTIPPIPRTSRPPPRRVTNIIQPWSRGRGRRSATLRLCNIQRRRRRLRATIESPISTSSTITPAHRTSDVRRAVVIAAVTITSLISIRAARIRISIAITVVAVHTRFATVLGFGEIGDIAGFWRFGLGCFATTARIIVV